MTGADRARRMPSRRAIPAPTVPEVRMATAAKSAVRLNDSQVLILQALAKIPIGSPGLTRAAIVEKTGAVVNAGNIGPAFKSVLENYPESLYGLGFVKPVQMPESDLTWEATMKGRAVSERYKGATLDPVVRKFIPTRTYGLELYTDDDLKEIRSALGDEHATLPLVSLRQQIVNRRKQGSYADRSEYAKKAAARTLREFGMVGTVFAGLLTEDQVAKLEEMAAD